MKCLADLINTVLLKEGRGGIARLAHIAGKGERMIDRYRLGHSVPYSETAYKLAMACGLNEEEALALARECSPVRAKETA